ncbi:MAG: monovalent cation/H(+) antiporter subunit G [Thermoplasmata archaeon]
MITNMVSLFLMCLGTVILFFASIAMIRFQDTYMRLHASSKATSGGSLTILLGLLLRTGLSETSGKIVLVILFSVLTAPIVGHAIGRAKFLTEEHKDTMEIKMYKRGDK